MLPASRATRPAASGAQRRAVERLGPGQKLLSRGQQVPLLRQGDQIGAVGSGRAHKPLRNLQVAGLVIVRVELYGRYTHFDPSRFHPKRSPVPYVSYADIKNSGMLTD